MLQDIKGVCLLALKFRLEMDLPISHETKKSLTDLSSIPGWKFPDIVNMTTKKYIHRIIRF